MPHRPTLMAILRDLRIAATDPGSESVAAH